MKIKFKITGDSLGGIRFEGETYQSEDDTTLSLLEKIFEGCNHGSRNEFKSFLEAKTRSLSVTDVVTLNSEERYYCDHVGWSKLEKV